MDMQTFIATMVARYPKSPLNDAITKTVVASADPFNEPVKDMRAVTTPEWVRRANRKELPVKEFKV
jgi:hypothetical protein